MLPAIGTHEELSLGSGHATYAGPSQFQMPEENLNNFDAHPLKLGVRKSAWSMRSGWVLFLLWSKGGNDCIAMEKWLKRFIPKLLT